MVEACRQEPRSHVAAAAIVTGGYVESSLAGGGVSIVAAGAVVDDTLVLEAGIGEQRWRMADRAILGDRDVRRIDLGVGAGRVDAVVAGRAVIDDAAVIEYRRREGTTGGVADIAILGGRHVAGSGVLAGGIDAVMAGIATQGQDSRVGVIDEGIGEIDRVVATRAVGGG